MDLCWTNDIIINNGNSGMKIGEDEKSAAVKNEKRTEELYKRDLKKSPEEKKNGNVISELHVML